MALYRYVKKPVPLPCRPSKIFKLVNLKVIPALLVAVGVFLVINAAYPIISYQLIVSPRFTPAFVSPTSEAAIAQSFGIAQEGERAVLGTEVDLLDMTKASNWFSEKEHFSEEEPLSYFISIPKLGINDALVAFGDDLKKSLIQYPGTAVPGRYGNAVVFGHSVLPQFFNSKNYATIFSTLPTLRENDEIWVKFNQITYKYVVEQMIEVPPDDISILAQRYDDSYLTLITCVPPGTYLRRLIVRARLTKI